MTACLTDLGLDSAGSKSATSDRDCLAYSRILASLWDPLDKAPSPTRSLARVNLTSLCWISVCWIDLQPCLETLPEVMLLWDLFLRSTRKACKYNMLLANWECLVL